MMTKFRKKPVEIEAVLFDGSERSLDKVWDLVDTAMGVNYTDGVLSIHTLEGAMKVSKGDWVIKGVKGEFYPCKPDIFELTYEKIGE
jgi:hypothetical protein